jgi:hypothetical protein
MNNIAEKVEAILSDSMFKEEEVLGGKTPTNAVIVDGVMLKFGFHSERLESHRAEVVEILKEMPREFHQDTGGGWSFLNLCMDSYGNQWGEHRNVE